MVQLPPSAEVFILHKKNPPVKESGKTWSIFKLTYAAGTDRCGRLPGRGY